MRKWLKLTLKTFKIGFRVFLVFVFLCYLSAYFYPRPLDYLVLTTHYFLFGRSEPLDVGSLVEFKEPAIGEIYDAEGKVVIKLAHEYRRINRYSDFPFIVVGAVLSTEDKRFFEHDGIDYWSLFTSVPWDVIGDSWEATSEHRPYFKPTLVMSRGGSTLTQQIVRLHFLSETTKLEKGDELVVNNWRAKLLALTPYVEVQHVNTVLRKIRELYDSIYTEREFVELYGSKRKAKEELFARYASSVYLGSVYGIGYAGEHYFGKNISDFTKDNAAEAALLAGMIKYPLPSIYSVKRQIPDMYLARKNSVLRLMAVNNYITYQEAGEFMDRKIEFAPLNVKTSAPSVINDVRKELVRAGFSSEDLFKGFVHVYSTIDLRVQNIANQALENGLAEYEKRHPEHKGKVQGAIVVMANDGRVLAVVGGRKIYNGKPYKYSDLNRANRLRQIGSAFKPFVYLEAFKQGHEPTDIISDSPVSINMGYGQIHPINNYDNKFLGPITMCEALYRSRNAPTVRLVKDILGYGYFENSGMKKVIDTARMLGVKSPFHSDVDHLGRTVYYPTSALGASEMTLTELTNAYREIASGISVEPYLVHKVIGRNGEAVFEKPHTGKLSAIDPTALDKIRSCLRKVVTQPGGTAYSLTLSNFPVPVMGKTGTTDDFRNAIFIGSTYSLNGVTVGASISFDDNTELGDSETGARAALPIFKEVTEEIYRQGLVEPASEFPPYIKILDPQSR